MLELLNLGKHPLADTFLQKHQLGAPIIYYPLVLAECSSCGHVLTHYYIPPEKRYIESEYSYDSSNSPVSENHFKEFAGGISATYQMFFPGTLLGNALDFGSNVGTLLKYLQRDFGVDVLGVEPSENIARLAVEHGIPTVCALFNKSLANDPQVAGRSFDVIASTNVVNHIDHLGQMMETVRALTHADSIFAFEVPYFVDLLEQDAFDTVYHEHVNYFSLQAIAGLLTAYDYEIADLQFINYMGGSLRVYALQRQKGSPSRAKPAVAAAMQREAEYFSSRPQWRQDLQKNSLQIKHTLLAFVHAANIQGKKICSIGAATKGNTLLNYCRLDVDAVQVCCDISRLKVGKWMPGSDIPIIHDDDLGSGWDYAIVLPWNLSAYLSEKFRKSGIDLVFPIQGHILTKDGQIETLG